MGLAAIELIRWEMEEAYRPFRDRLDGLSEEEFWWEPVAGSWTLHRRSDGRWYGDYEEPDPEPAPFTTIAWRLNHIAACKVMYHEYAFGAREITWDTIEVPATVESAIAMLERGHAFLVEDLARLDDDRELERPRLTNWGEEWPTRDIFWTMIWHDAHHGGEIGAVRDLYLHSVALPGEPATASEPEGRS
jgi:uncharacterized damage-inducible protein DinB